MEFHNLMPNKSDTIDLKTQILLQQFQQKEKQEQAMKMAEIVGLSSDSSDCIKNKKYFWWAKARSNPFLISIVSAIVAIIILFLLNPPIVQKKKDLPIYQAQPDLVKILIYSTLVGSIVYIVPLILSIKSQ